MNIVSFNQWLTAFRKEYGRSIAGMKKILKTDYDEGFSPSEAASLWIKGFDPNSSKVAGLSLAIERIGGAVPTKITSFGIQADLS